MSTVPPPQPPPPQQQQQQFVGHYFTSDPGVTETYIEQWLFRERTDRLCLVGRTLPPACQSVSPTNRRTKDERSVSQTIFFICKTFTSATACCLAPSFRQSCTANQCNWGPLLASSKSGVTHITCDVMAVHRPHEEGSTSSSMSISAIEPTATVDCNRKTIHSETGKCFSFMLCLYKHDFTITPSYPMFYCQYVVPDAGPFSCLGGFSVNTFALRLLMMLHKHSFITCSCCTLVLKHSIV